MDASNTKTLNGEPIHLGQQYKIKIELNGIETRRRHGNGMCIQRSVKLNSQDRRQCCCQLLPLQRSEHALLPVGDQVLLSHFRVVDESLNRAVSVKLVAAVRS